MSRKYGDEGDEGDEGIGEGILSLLPIVLQLCMRVIAIWRFACKFARA